MPAAFEVLALWAAGSTAGGALLATAAFQIATVAYGVYSSNAARRAQARASEFQGQSVTIRESDAPKWKVYGRTRPPKGLLYHCIHPTNTDYYTIVLDVAHHEIDGFEDVLADGKSIGALGGGVWNGEIITEGLPQPGSRFYKSETRTRSKTLTWPANGQTLNFVFDEPAANYSLATVAIADPDGRNIEYPQYGPQQGVDFNWTPGSTTLSVISSTFAGREITVTYMAEVGQPLARFRFFRGIPEGERDLILEVESNNAVGEPDHPKRWLPSDIGCNVARVAITMLYDREIYGRQGMPEWDFVIRGKRVRSWIDNSYSWSANSARCVLDHIIDPYMGFGEPTSSIPQAMAVTEQNICDESVVVGGLGITQPRYRLNGAITSDATLFDSLRLMLATCAGGISHSVGYWDLRVGYYRTPIVTLEDKDFKGGQRDAHALTDSTEQCNVVQGRFTNPLINYQGDNFVAYRSNYYIGVDGEELPGKEINLPLVTDNLQAQRLAKIHMMRTRNSYRWTAPYSYAAYPLSALDNVYLRHQYRGWHNANSGLGKSFQVTVRELDITKGVRLEAVEDFPELYDWNYAEGSTPDPGEDIILPDPRFVRSPTNVVAISDATTYRMLSDGTIIPYILLKWDRPSDRSIVSYEIEYKNFRRANFDKIEVGGEQTEARIEPASAGETYNIVIRARNAVSAVSRDLNITHVASLDLPNYINSSSGGNLIFNATLAAGDAGWEYVTTGFTPSPVIDYLGPPRIDAEALGKKLGLSPNNLLLFQGTMVAGTTIKARSRPIPVDPTHPVVGMVRLALFNCTGTFGIQEFGVDGQMIAETLGASVSDFPTFYWATPEASRDATNLAVYTQRGKFFTLNAATRTIRFFAIKYENGNDATFGWLFMTQPMIARAQPGQMTLPPWNPGGQNSVDTTQIEVDAATTVYKPSANVATMTLMQFQIETWVEVMRFTPEVAGRLEVSLSAEVASLPNWDAYVIEAGYYISGVVELESGIKAFARAENMKAVIQNGADNTLKVGGVQRNGVYTTVAGQQVVVYTALRRSIAARTTRAEKSADGTDDMRNVEIHATHIKR